jgi:2-dehydropantoate 2-reductase
LVNPEVILIAVKAGQVAGLLPSLRGMLGPGTIVVTIQNGVRTVDEVRKSIGAAPTYGGSCYLVSYLSAPGNVRHVGVAPKLKIGNIASNTRNEKTAIQFINALREAGIMAEMVHDIQDVLWSKVVLAASLGVVGSLTRVKIGVFREVPETRELLSRVMLEVVAVARSRGIKMPDNWVQRTMGFVDSMPFASDSSLQRDIMHGKPSELEYVVGDLVRYAASAGFDVPILRWGYSCILAAEKQTQALTAQASR